MISHNSTPLDFLKLVWFFFDSFASVTTSVGLYFRGRLAFDVDNITATDTLPIRMRKDAGTSSLDTRRKLDKFARYSYRFMLVWFDPMSEDCSSEDMQ